VNFLKGRSFLPCIISFHLAFEHNLPSINKQLWFEMISIDSNTHSVFHAEKTQLVYKRGVTLANVLISTKCLSILDDMDTENVQILLSLATKAE